VGRTHKLWMPEGVDRIGGGGAILCRTARQTGRVGGGASGRRGRLVRVLRVERRRRPRPLVGRRHSVAKGLQAEVATETAGEACRGRGVNRRGAARKVQRGPCRKCSAEASRPTQGETFRPVGEVTAWRSGDRPAFDACDRGGPDVRTHDRCWDGVSPRCNTLVNQ